MRITVDIPPADADYEVTFSARDLATRLATPASELRSYLAGCIDRARPVPPPPPFTSTIPLHGDGPMDLGDFTDELERLMPDKPIRFAGSDWSAESFYVPTRFGSWRGSYSQLMLGCELYEVGVSGMPTTTSLLELAHAANGGEFESWKSGPYKFDRTRRIYIANDGEVTPPGSEGHHYVCPVGFRPGGNGLWVEIVTMEVDD